MIVRASLATAIALFIAMPTAAADAPSLDLRPGVSIYVVNNETQIQSVCSLGWLALSPQGDVQALTAGHCRTGPQVDALDQRTGAKVEAGQWAQSEYTPRTVMDGDDIAVITLTSHLGHDVKTVDGIAPVAVATTQGLRDTPPARICKRGGQTGVTCGPLVSVSDDRVAFRAEVDHGDSGGPVWAVSPSGVVTAAAIVAGKSDDDPSIAVGQLINPWLVRWHTKLGVPQ
ncbi:hypothetical protein [Mycobacterium intracellulare]|uniref:hypothetical protein n=1 Tax=Mycobacterium intracellulare TaxID=1767 RepID=UPI0011AB31D1|nr:hypothetical protein [Mycobacterium intracellulare]